MTTGGAPVEFPQTPPAESDHPAEQVSRAVLEVPGVVALSAGPFGEVGTYLLGGRVPGVRKLKGRWEIHLVARFGSNLTVLARHVQLRVGPLVDGPVDVRIVDIADPGDSS